MAQWSQSARVIEQLSGQHDGVQAAKEVSSIGDGLSTVGGDCAYELSARQHRRKQAVLRLFTDKGLQRLRFFLSYNEFDQGGGIQIDPHLTSVHRSAIDQGSSSRCTGKRRV